ncbi:MAG: thymidine phosphorylase [Rubripirellula sp.]
MLVTNLLRKKRDGGVLQQDEIEFLIDGYCRGDVTEYQMSAFAMAVAIRGMDPVETATLTRAMLASGKLLQRPDRGGDLNAERPRVDKHSTGGLGDKVSLILAPLLAVCDLDVPMISGRGLGSTGGTLDKLESIAGFQTQFEADQLDRILADCGAFIAGATQHIAPADQKLYALRDVTATVESVPLITASILSKKLAANLDALVMDVKVGDAGFMKTPERALELAKSLVSVGGQAGLPTTAWLTDMDQPLGEAVGNAIEVNESVEILRGAGGPVRDLTIELCADLLERTNVADDMDSARTMLAQRLDSGLAMERFERMVAAQGGKLTHPLPLAASHPILAPRQGYLSHFDCAAIGDAVVCLGGGRRKVGDRIDHQVGIRVHGRLGDFFEKSQPVMTLHCSVTQADEYTNLLADSFNLSCERVESRPLVLERLGIPGLE